MGVHTRPVPVNVLNWPKIRPLSLPAKFLYIYLYFCGESSACGCYLFGTTTAAALIGISVEEVEEILKKLQSLSLITCCKDTGEIYVHAWPEWHLFKSTEAKHVLKSAIDAIKNIKMKSHLIEEYKHIIRTEISSKKGKTESQIWHGIYLHNHRDFQIAELIDKRFSEVEITQTIRELIGNNQRILPSIVLKKISQIFAPTSKSIGPLNSPNAISKAAKKLGIVPRRGESYDELKLRIETKLDEKNENTK